MLSSFVSEQIGIMVPGNDVMSAIVALFIEILSYGILIFSLILFLLCYIIDSFTHNVEECQEEDKFPGVGDLDRSTSNFLLFFLHICTLLLSVIEKKAEIDNVLYPSYFKKWQESFLDICFLAFPTVVVVLMLVPTLGFLYNSHYTWDNVLETSISIDIIGHQ